MALKLGYRRNRLGLPQVNQDPRPPNEVQSPQRRLAGLQINPPPQRPGNALAINPPKPAPVAIGGLNVKPPPAPPPPPDPRDATYWANVARLQASAQGKLSENTL